MNRIMRHRSFDSPQKPCYRGENIDCCDTVELQLASLHPRSALPYAFPKNGA